MYVCDIYSYWLDICRPGSFKLNLVLLFCLGIFSFRPGNVLESFCEVCVDTLKGMVGRSQLTVTNFNSSVNRKQVTAKTSDL